MEERGTDKLRERMLELIKILNEAGKAYYQESREIMSNLEYDRLYDELLKLEKDSGILLSSSPTQKVGYEVLSELPKEEHESPMLSLNKTKDVEELASWLGSNKALLSWKLDGLTIVLSYRNGELVKAVTRGNGYIGEVITQNAKVFTNMPLKIDFKGELIIRGEAVISYSDFERINDAISDADAKYKNPRNLCSGSVRQLDSSITKKRNVSFNAFMLVRAEGVDFENSRKKQFEWLKNQGFDVVEHVLTDSERLREDIDDFASRIESMDIPSDGLVLLLDDIEYGNALGSTAKFPRNAIAFKWRDEIRDTKLRYIEWSPSRTGLINPIAVFEPVELEGTTVSRASVHNLSILEALELGEGDTISVYKANMIIPQIAENKTRSKSAEIPKLCPVCKSNTVIKQEGDVRTLYCTNPDCQAKHIKGYALLAGRDALNIEGLSEMSIEKLILSGCISSPADIFRLKAHRDIIVNMEGFGEKSYEKLISAIEAARHTTAARLIYALGIPGIGSANAKMISRHFKGSFEAFAKSDATELTGIEGIGEVLAKGIEDYFADERKASLARELAGELILEDSEAASGGRLEGLSFVITGSTEHFANRSELKSLIESEGGKVLSAVSNKTNYLINNDKLSGSSKNKKAAELGIAVISEEDFMKLLDK